jgi:hypothetical protein
MKYLLMLVLCCAGAQALAETYTLVIKTQINVPGTTEMWNEQPVNLASMAGVFYVGPFAEYSQCQSFKNAGVTGMFNGSTFNTLPINVSVMSLHCEDSASLP